MFWRKLARTTSLVALLTAAVACNGGDETGTITGACIGEDGKLLAAVEVTTEPATSVALSDSTGTYLLSGIEPGEYKVRAARNGYVPAEKTAQVEAGRTATVDFTLEPAIPAGTVAGRIADALTDVPVIGAAVATDPGSCTAITGPGGTYVLDEVPAGSYRVRVTAAAYEEGLSASISVTEGQTTTVDMQLAATPAQASTCQDCHVDRDLLLADLIDDPPPDATNPEGSAGEG